jgi:predicted TIM-barrel fold metal-dependent hydrolase
LPIIDTHHHLWDRNVRYARERQDDDRQGRRYDLGGG